MSYQKQSPFSLVGPLAFIVMASMFTPHAMAADAENGLTLATKWCNACHSIGAEEPRQEDAGPLFTDLSGKDVAYLNVAINRPHDFMPDFPSLSNSDKADLVAYIQSLK